MVDEVVDTSDVEERELLAAKDSRYYAQAWNQNVQTPTNCPTPIRDASPQFAGLGPVYSTVARQSTPTLLDSIHISNNSVSQNHLDILDTVSPARVPRSRQVSELHSLPSSSPDPISLLSLGTVVNKYPRPSQDDLDFHESSPRYLIPDHEISLEPTSFTADSPLYVHSRARTPPHAVFTPETVNEKTPFNSLNDSMEVDRVLHRSSMPSPIEDIFRASTLSPPPPLSPPQNQGQIQRRSRSLSPLHSPDDHGNSQLSHPERISDRANEGLLQSHRIEGSPDRDPPGRKYSLRDRSAKQLNPFLYDKRQYTRLLKGVPEAIVKDINQGYHVGKRDRYEEEEEGAENFEPDPEDDDEERWRSRQKRKEERQRKREERLKANVRLKELGIIIPSDDDDDDDDILRDDKFVEKRGKKRKRDPIKRLQISPVSNVDSNSPTKDGGISSASASKPQSRPRPRPVFRKGLPSPAESQQERINPMQSQIGFEFPFNDSQAGFGDLFVHQEEPSFQTKEMDFESQIDTASEPEKASDELESGKRLRRQVSSNLGDADVPVLDSHTEDVQEVYSTDQANSESEDGDLITTKTDRKRMKILRRVMPAAAIKKLLANERHKEGKKNNSLHKIQNKETPLLPGQARKRIVTPNSNDPKRYEIKGDTESASQSESDNERQRGNQQSDPEVIIIDDNSGVEVVSEEDIGQRLEDSEDELDAAGIHTWLDPSPLRDSEHHTFNASDQNTITGSQPRQRRPRADEPRGGDLIDRMLQRTRRVGLHAEAKSRSKAKQRGDGVGAHRPSTTAKKKSGHRYLKQTKLSFSIERHGVERRNARISHRQEGYRASDTGAHNEAGLTEEENTDIYHGPQESVQELDKTKSRKRKNRGIVPNIYINQHNGQQITSGRLRRIIRIDIHDDNFHSALSPEEIDVGPVRSRPLNKRIANQIARLTRGEKQPDPNDFGIGEELASRSRVGKISLDSDMSLLPSGISLGSEGYIGKGQFFELLSFLKGEADVAKPPALLLPDLFINPDASTEQLLTTLGSVCDMIYSASMLHEGADDYSTMRQNVERVMHTVCHLVTYRLLHCTKEDTDVLVTTISEQLHHMVGRKEQSLELVSGDGFSLDAYAFALYWFALEVRVRILYVLKRSEREVTRANYSAIEQEIVRLLCRLLEYGFERTVGELQKKVLQPNTTFRNFRIVECWVSAFYISPFIPPSNPESLSKLVPPFWKYIELALEKQSNTVDARLFQSERIWRTVFGLCTLSQFSPEGISTSTARLESYWPIVKKALQCIRLSADPKLDSDKPITALQQRDAYVRLVTARCLLLADRWNWKLQEAEEVFRELCNIFRSRSFANLLGEINDFPLFIREKDESRIYEYESADSAYSLFLKLTIRAANELKNAQNGDRRQGAKLTRLLSLVVPVGSLSFTKENPPIDQALSMLYNRYSAIFVAIYVNPSEVRTRIQQACRYVAFRQADGDSRTAAIRGIMYIAILLRHLDKPLDDILQWASEIMDDLLTEVQQVGESAKGETLLMLQLVIGTLRSIIVTPCLKGRENRPATYPNILLVQVWMSRLLSIPLGAVPKDHRTGEEMCKCIQAFLSAREAVFPSAPLIQPSFIQEEEESQEYYSNLDLDLDDPALAALLNNLTQSPVQNENCDADQRASEILDSFSQGTYACLYQHIRCKVFDEGPYFEADTWMKAWVGLGSVIVRYKRRSWPYYFQLVESAWSDVPDILRRTHIRQQFMTSVLNADPTVYKTNQIQVLTVWLETLVSPEVTVQHEFTALLFNIDGLRHKLLRQMPCQPDETSGFNFNRAQFCILRLQLIRQILINLSAYWDLQQDEDQMPFLQIPLDSIKSYTEAINNGSSRALEYATFRNEICSQLRTHQTLLQYRPVQAFLNWADVL